VTLLAINALLFVIFGLAFVFVPDQASPMFLGVPAPGGDLLVDMRATYGGLSLAVGVAMGYCAYRSELLKPGLILALLVTLGLLTGRVVGIVDAGSVGPAMYQSLGFEVFLSSLFGWLFFTTPKP
jgi:hypothetical protein